MSEARINSLSNENDTGGPTISGITTFSGTNYFVPPVGTTAERPDNSEKGSIRFNIDTKHLEYYRGDGIGWVEIEASNEEFGGLTNSAEGRGTRALWAGGYIAPGPCFNNVDAITIETLGNTMDFNNLEASQTGGFTCSDRTRAVYAGGRTTTTPGGPNTDMIQYATFSTQQDYADSGTNLTTASAFGSAFSDKTRGVFAGRSSPGYNKTMEYVTVQTLGECKDFGDLHQDVGYTYAFASSTRGFVLGGLKGGSPAVSYNVIEYFTTQTTGDGTDFGDLNYTKYEGGAGSNATRGIVAAGYGPNYTSRIEYITMATKGNSTYFGDLINLNGSGKYSAASPTRMVVGGGYIHPATPFSNVIEYVQFASSGNASDFGDFSNFGRRANSFNNTSNGHGGL